MALTVGNLVFNVTGNTSGLQKSLDKLNEFSKVVTQAARQQEEGANAAAKALAMQERAIKSALNSALNLRQKLQEADAPGKMFGQVTNAFKGLTNSLTAGVASTTNYTRAQDKFRLIMGQVTRDLRDFKDKQNAASDNKFLAFFENLKSSAVLAAGPLSGVASRISAITAVAERSSISVAAFLVASSATVVGLGALSIAAAKAAIELQSIENTLLVGVGSTTAAKLEFQYVHDVALKLGVSIQSLASNYASLSAATRNTALSGAETRHIFEGLSTAVAALRRPVESVNGIMLAFTQMISIGKVRSQELVTQLAQHIPGSMKLAADAMGITTDKLRQQMEAGTLLTKDFLPKLADQWIKVFGSTAAEQANSLAGAINNLKTHTFDALTAFDSAIGISDGFKASINVLSGALAFAANNMQQIVGAFGAMTGAAIAFLAIANWGAIVAGWNGITKAIIAFSAAARAATISVAALMAVMTGGLAFLARAAVVIAAAAAGYALLAPKVDTVTESTKKLTAATDELLSHASNPGAYDQQIDVLRSKIADFKQQIDDLLKSSSTWWGKILDKTHITNSTEKLITLNDAITELNGKIKQIEEGKKAFEKFQEGIEQSKEAADALARAMRTVSELRQEYDALNSGQSQQQAQRQKQVQTMVEELKQHKVAMSDIVVTTMQYGQLLDNIAATRTFKKEADDIKNLQLEYAILAATGSATAAKQAADVDKQRQKLIDEGVSLQTANELLEKRANILNKISSTNALLKFDEQVKKTLEQAQAYANNISPEKFKLAEKVREDTKALQDQGVAFDAATAKAKNLSDANEILLHNQTLYEQRQERLKTINDTIEHSFDSLGDSIADFSSGTKDMATAFSDAINSIIHDLLRLLAQKYIIDELKDLLNLNNTKTSAGGQATNFLTDIFSFMGFAGGGSVTKGNPIIVGEKGKEVFVPQSDGYIIPNNVAFNSSPTGSSLSMGGATIVQPVINVVNNNGSQVSTRTRNDNGTSSIDVIIDEAMSRNMANKGTKTNQLLNSYAGRQVIRR